MQTVKNTSRQVTGIFFADKPNNQRVTGYLKLFICGFFS